MKKNAFIDDVDYVVVFGDGGADCVLCLGMVVLIVFWWFGMVMTVFGFGNGDAD